jgi:hypothetical protein
MKMASASILFYVICPPVSKDLLRIMMALALPTLALSRSAGFRAEPLIK